jgi:hypothetical protein
VLEKASARKYRVGAAIKTTSLLQHYSEQNSKTHRQVKVTVEGEKGE